MSMRMFVMVLPSLSAKPCKVFTHNHFIISRIVLISPLVCVTIIQQHCLFISNLVIGILQGMSFSLTR